MNTWQKSLVVGDSSVIQLWTCIVPRSKVVGWRTHKKAKGITNGIWHFVCLLNNFYCAYYVLDTGSGMVDSMVRKTRQTPCSHAICTLVEGKGINHKSHVKTFSGKCYKRDLICGEVASLRKWGFSLRSEGGVGVNYVRKRLTNMLGRGNSISNGPAWMQCSEYKETERISLWLGREQSWVWHESGDMRRAKLCRVLFTMLSS